jgi:formylglycine-generating enzyme required for sulfatase activity
VSVEDQLGLVGTTLEGKYRIDEVVASGGFALVYRATHLVWNRPVAIKAFYALADLPEASRAKLVEEFVREGALLAELSEQSAAIVQARDVGTLTTASGDHVPYMILEWLDGATLEAVLRDERARGVPLRTAVEMVALLDPIAEALALAHRKGIAHRDVKPPNIYILGDPRAAHCTLKLLDFGIAKVVQDAQKIGGSFAKTGGNVTSFTPAYAAPEQFSRTHGATGPWTDVFALALVASEVLSGKEPLQGDSFVQLGFAAADRTTRPTPRTLGVAISDDLEAVFAKALSVTPSDRYQTAAELWSAVRSALAMAPMPTAAVSSPGPMPATSDARAFAETQHAAMVTQPPPSSGRRFWVVGAVALVLAGGIAVVYPKTKASVATPPPPPQTTSTPAVHEACPKDAVLVPGGPSFQGMDNPPLKYPYLANEKPQHPVRLSPFCMDRYEVNVEKYAACSTSGACSRASTVNAPLESFSDAQHKAYDPVCNENDRVGRGNHPVNCVTWDQAQKFCARAGGQLPTEAQWEFAARGKDQRVYPWGDDPPSAKTGNACGTECIAWAKEHGVDGDFPGAMYDANDKFPTTAPIGSFASGASQFGIEDLVGNVAEWTADYYAAYPHDTKTEAVDPKGPEKGDERVIRGGAWNASIVAWARPTFRFHAPETNQNHGIGFRCAYSPR